MDERLKILELVREGKVTPEQGTELLAALEHGYGDRVVESFVDLHDDEQGPARQLKFTSVSRKLGKDTKHIFNLPLGMIKFMNSIFPNAPMIQVNSKHLDREQLMEFIHSGEKGVIYREESEQGSILIELV
jgi:hypothetical protein